MTRKRRKTLHLKPKWALRERESSGNTDARIAGLKEEEEEAAEDANKNIYTRLTCTILHFQYLSVLHSLILLRHLRLPPIPNRYQLNLKLQAQVLGLIREIQSNSAEICGYLLFAREM